MPDEIDPNDLTYWLYLKQKLEAAEADVAAGNVVDHEEVMRLIDSWRE